MFSKGLSGNISVMPWLFRQFQIFNFLKTAARCHPVRKVVVCDAARIEASFFHNVKKCACFEYKYARSQIVPFLWMWSLLLLAKKSVLYMPRPSRAHLFFCELLILLSLPAYKAGDGNKKISWTSQLKISDSHFFELQNIMEDVTFCDIMSPLLYDEGEISHKSDTHCI